MNYYGPFSNAFALGMVMVTARRTTVFPEQPVDQKVTQCAAEQIGHDQRVIRAKRVIGWRSDFPASQWLP
jgi:hypothetical protein